MIPFGLRAAILFIQSDTKNEREKKKSPWESYTAVLDIVDHREAASRFRAFKEILQDPLTDFQIERIAGGLREMSFVSMLLNCVPNSGLLTHLVQMISGLYKLRA